MYFSSISMVFQKNHSRIIIAGAGMLALLFFAGCNKLKTKDHVIFNITALMPHNNTPVAGVRYRIVESKYKSRFGKLIGQPTPTGWELEGVTNSEGKASGDFKGVLKVNYSYTIYFDYTAMHLPPEMSNYTIDGPEYAILQRSSPESNSYDVRILPMCYIHSRIENVNCANSNDSMRYKTYSYDEQPNQSFEYVTWSNYFVGCGVHSDYTNPNLVIGGHRVYQIEVTRNGNTTTHIDTFNLLPNQMNNVFLEY
jgi:hypothetical protein